ncbi:hypothetical protein M8C21_007839, partial [Ambrosia artemisiifolia]
GTLVPILELQRGKLTISSNSSRGAPFLHIVYATTTITNPFSSGIINQDLYVLLTIVSIKYG